MTLSKAYYIFAFTKLYVGLLSCHVLAHELVDNIQPHNSHVLSNQIHTTLQSQLDGTPEMRHRNFPHTHTSKFKGQYIPRTSKYGGQSSPHSLTIKDKGGMLKFGDQPGIQALKFRGPSSSVDNAVSSKYNFQNGNPFERLNWRDSKLDGKTGTCSDLSSTHALEFQGGSCKAPPRPRPTPHPTPVSDIGNTKP